MIASVFLRTLADSAIDSSSLLLEWQDTGGHVPDRSDCTRRPEPGLCSLTDLEAVLGRRASTSHPVTPLLYQEFSGRLTPKYAVMPAQLSAPYLYPAHASSVRRMRDYSSPVGKGAGAGHSQWTGACFGGVVSSRSAE